MDPNVQLQRVEVDQAHYNRFLNIYVQSKEKKNESDQKLTILQKKEEDIIYYGQTKQKFSPGNDVQRSTFNLWPPASSHRPIRDPHNRFHFRSPSTMPLNAFLAHHLARHIYLPSSSTFAPSLVLVTTGALTKS